jgi:hypothetical protein
MRLIIYCLTTLAAWIVSQRLLSFYDEDRIVDKKYVKNHNKQCILSYLNPLFWSLYLWHGIQTYASSYIYYLCPLAWFSGIIIVFTKIMWYSKKWRSYITSPKMHHKRANYALKNSINTHKKLKFKLHHVVNNYES